MGSLFESTANTRVLPTGDMRYVRSDYPEQLTDEDVHWLIQNDIRTIVDLREEKEYSAKPCRLESEQEFTYLHLPVTGGGDLPASPEDALRSYLDMLDKQMDWIVDMIIYASSGVLFFCKAGKDRAGVVSAVILKKLGCDDQTIIDDYMESKNNLLADIEIYAAEHPDVDIDTIMPKEENIRRVLAELAVKTESEDTQ